MKRSVERPPLFGTNGIRGEPNADLTPDMALQVGKSIGTYFQSTTIAMGRDTRDTGPMIFNAVSSGIMSAGKDILDLGVLPTPAIQYYCKINKIPGVVITASHNPPRFNGIKCIAADGTELPRGQEEDIESIYYDRSFYQAPWNICGKIRIVTDAIELYLTGIIRQVDAEAIRTGEFRVAFDAGNGAAYMSTPELLRRLGCSVVTLNANPDGKFTSRNSEPRPENLKDLINVVSGGKFDLGIAHDGDADRAVFVDSTGHFVDGDITLSLIVKSTIRPGDRVVTPISSSDAMDEVCNAGGAELIRTRVGAPLVSRTMIEKKAKIGGEENGGIIYGPHQYCRDGAMTAALVLNLMAARKAGLKELVSEIPEYHIHKLSTDRKVEWETIKRGILGYVSGMKTDTSDGIKVFLKDGWVLVRPSGTEPIIRIYGESRTVARARDIAQEYQALIDGIQEGASAL
ncbi:MAG: phosphoglucosamine mutase [Thermoplasmataceae archaeon]